MSNLTGGDVCEVMSHPRIINRELIGNIIVLTRVHPQCGDQSDHNRQTTCPHWQWIGCDPSIALSWQILRKMPPPADLIVTRQEEVADV